MKILPLCGLALSLVTTVFGQGQVQFNNRFTGITPWISAPVYLDYVGGQALSGSQYRAALLGGPLGSEPWRYSDFWDPDFMTGGTGMSMLGSPTTGATWVTFRTGAAAGFIAAGGDAARVVPGVNWGETGVFQMVAWSGNYNDFASALNAARLDPNVCIGVSNPLTLTLPSSASDPSVTYLVGLEPFALHRIPVPEPGSLVLLSWGLAGLLLWKSRGALAVRRSQRAPTIR